ncbi:precorrin-2 C(20)-methyltransferase [Leptothermofonsia sp. ETS-13]|uniref:precorrin-2 C(20)-methyltransferase n=1 Tax=Leptothermofonsia sp. ETS-13 TaxID=3035696 RepID=UPI003BA3BCB0
MPVGTLYGISVGPGDPELLTLKGLRLLKQSPVVAFPAGVRGQPGIAQQIITKWLRQEQVLLPLTFPYIQDDHLLMQAWKAAAGQVWHYLSQGADVAFACEGDVGFYSTFTYLAQTLQHLYPPAEIQIVPGVSSPLAAAAVLGLPLTLRHQRLVILPALYTATDLKNVLRWAEVVVLLKVSSVYRQVWDVLHELELLEHSYVVERATQPGQVIHHDLVNKPNLALPYFSLLVVQAESPDR